MDNVSRLYILIIIYFMENKMLNTKFVINFESYDYDLCGFILLLKERQTLVSNINSIK